MMGIRMIVFRGRLCRDYYKEAEAFLERDRFGIGSDFIERRFEECVCSILSVAQTYVCMFAVIYHAGLDRNLLLV